MTTSIPDNESNVARLDQSSPTSILRRAQRVWTYRELLGALTRRELKIKYKDSLLGFLWTLLNPLLYLVVFSIVFTGFLRANVPLYGLFLLSGLLAWTLFSTGVTAATTSITTNGPLVQKVWFPREILPLSAIMSSLVNFFFQIVVLFVALVAFGRAPEWSYLPLIIPALIVTMIWAMALGIVLSALNVHLRDVQHFLELALLAWFWMTPIVYQFDFVGDQLIEKLGSDRLAILNPMIAVTTTLQRVIYNPVHEIGTPAEAGFDLLFKPVSWYIENLAVTGVAGLVVLWIGMRIFGRLEADLGEEL